MWHEHELGDYPSIGLLWEHPEQTDVPWEYMSRCEAAVAILDEAISWSKINPAEAQETFEAEDEGEREGDNDM